MAPVCRTCLPQENQVGGTCLLHLSAAPVCLRESGEERIRWVAPVWRLSGERIRWVAPVWAPVWKFEGTVELLPFTSHSDAYLPPYAGSVVCLLSRKHRKVASIVPRIFLGLAVAAIAYVVIVAAFQAIGSSLHFHDLLLPRLVDCLVFAWLFWVGSAVGSFLNVVAWRMPRGRSINGLSHCPWCANRLAPRDNWPVFGWLALRGRCRTCRLPISPRYPIVELVVALSLTSLGLAEVYGALANLPFPKELRGHWHGPLSMPVVNRETMAFWLFHTFAVAGAWAFGLVRFDSQRLPKKLVIWVLGAAIIPILIWPPFMVVPWQVVTPDAWAAKSHLDAVVRVLCGLAAAVFVARGLARFVCPSADPKLDPTSAGTGRLMDLIGVLAIPGVIVGWQALFGVTLLATLIAALLLQRFKQLQRDGLAWFSVSLPVALTIQLTFWRELESFPYWPSTQSTPTTILFYALAALTLPWLIRSRVTTPTDDSIDTTASAIDESVGLD